MSEVLYQKYRPKKMNQVAGQDHIVQTLTNALNSQQISHAYLFCGPRGSGKTSVARILANILNNTKQNDTNLLDIIEIDAASNRRIDEIRDLRDKVNILPASAPYKIYIIDEVHMLTKEAFNALLKTLEEPPKHVIFIMATTEVHKVPATIISRTQKFTFRPANDDVLAKHLLDIAQAENIQLTDDGAIEIAKHASGSFRDALSLLDQLRSVDQKLDVQNIHQQLGIAPEHLLDGLLSAVLSGQISDISQFLDQITQAGGDPTDLKNKLISNLKNRLISNINDKFMATNIIDLMKNLSYLPSDLNLSQNLEISLFDSAFRVSSNQNIQNIEPIKNKLVQQKNKVTNKDTIKVHQKTSDQVIAPKDDNLWANILHQLKKNYNTLYSIARMADCLIDEQTIKLTFNFEFHKNRLSEAKNQQILNDICYKLTGQQYQFELYSEKSAKKTASASLDSQTMGTISNIFGQTEVIESS